MVVVGPAGVQIDFELHLANGWGEEKVLNLSGNQLIHPNQHS